MNRQPADTWDRFAPHRARVMDLVPRPEGKGTLAVFGAGSCSDIDLEELARTFQSVHLVDMDAEALERARERQPEATRARIVTHGDIDLSGFLSHIETWGERFPTPQELAPTTVRGAIAILQRLGENFDVTLSTCVLSQFIHPYQRCLALSGAEWISLETTLVGLHLTTLAGATRSHGRGLIVFDVASSDDIPKLCEARDADPEDLQTLVMQQVDPSALRPDPWNLVRQVGAANLFANPRLTLPWLWDIGVSLQLVYGLAFERP